MIKENAINLMKKLEFSIDAQDYLLKSLDKLLLTDDFMQIIKYYEQDNSDFLKMLDDVKILAEKVAISHYTANMVLFICISPILYKKYKRKGISDEVFYNTMSDLRYKLDECWLVHGVYGTFVATWYKGFFEMRIFALGRLQFEIKNTWFECDVNGVHIPKDTKVLSVHIPRTGTPLYHKSVVDSYISAKEFFKNEFSDNIIFICNSWLLYPWNRTVYKDGTNLALFYDDFTIIQSGEYNNYSETWRLFDCLYDGNPDNLPADTSLRKAFIERIKNNEPIGHGTGVIVF